MSTINVEVVEIKAVTPHPNADRLDVASVLGTQCVVAKGTLQPGWLAYWFPPNILIPDAVAEHLGVASYLKHAVYPGLLTKTQCRVSACRIRGVASYGFLVAIGPPDAHWPFKIGDDVSAQFDAVKYEPPVRVGLNGRVKFENADAAPEHPAFHHYTDIENFYKYPDAIPDKLHVRITEKIHGTNCRLGLVFVHGEWQFMCGSRKVNRKPVNANGTIPLYWEMLTENVVELLTELCDEKQNVIVFGEIYGPGIHDMDYGVAEPSLRVFDIAMNGNYLSWPDLVEICQRFDVAHVPLVYAGEFSRDLLEQVTHGTTLLCDAPAIACPFKGREGVVITPLTEQFSDDLRGRLILKSVSADYLDRKNAEDN